MAALVLRAGVGALMRPRHRPALPAASTGQSFVEWDADLDDGDWHTARSDAWMAHLARLDEEAP